MSRRMAQYLEQQTSKERLDDRCQLDQRSMGQSLEWARAWATSMGKPSRKLPEGWGTRILSVY